MREFLDSNPSYTFPFATSAKTWDKYLYYDIRGIPRYVVIDTEGVIRSHGHDWEAAAKVALELLDAIETGEKPAAGN